MPSTIPNTWANDCDCGIEDGGGISKVETGRSEKEYPPGRWEIIVDHLLLYCRIDPWRTNTKHDHVEVCSGGKRERLGYVAA